MHEVDMTKALIQTVREWARSQPENPEIKTIHLTVGKFTCVEPASLKFAFSVQTKNTDLDGVNLTVHETPLIGFCHRCQREYQPEFGLKYACPDCHSPLEDIRSGRELKIDRIEYSTPSKVPSHLTPC